MISCIILAAGSGTRMGADVNKVFLDLDGYPVLYHSIKAFEDNKDIDEIVVVLKEDEINKFNKEFKKYKFKKITQVIEGGEERIYSVLKGFVKVDKECAILLIHDGARPFVSQNIIDEAINFAKKHGAAAPGIPVTDTIKKIDDKGFVSEELERSELVAIQTPQAFVYEEFKEAMKSYRYSMGVITDDTSFVFKHGKPVFIFRGEEKNIKITNPEDMKYLMKTD
ncbi:MAG: 2-C-methyl-D-erythritol 4-phosphate cytidylyltransferase [Clostridiaceae bacterium]